MKRREFIRELEQHQCFLKRHGSNHDIYMNALNGRKSSLPRHNEIKETLCTLIRKQLGIPHEQ
ncbi:MAG: type II toxin-antitoxin system HicA family toxin [Bacteroidota bacterium]